MTTKFQPGDWVQSSEGYTHLIWAVSDEEYFYEIYYKGNFKDVFHYPINSYENGPRYKISKLALALM